MFSSLLIILLAASLCQHSISQFIQCDTPYVCSNQTWNITNSAYPRGYKGLYGKQASLFAGGELACYGGHSCEKIHSATVSGDFDCWGDHSCYGITTKGLTTTGGYTYCYGDLSCAHTTILSIYNHIICGGRLSCSNSIINQTPVIWARGAYVLYNSIIHSTNGMQLFMYGYLAGYNGTLICADHHSCTVQCRGNGCRNFRMDCSGNGTTCTVQNCDESQNVACPMYINYTSIDYNNTIASQSNTELLDIMFDDINVYDSSYKYLKKLDENICDNNRDDKTFDDYSENDFSIDIESYNSSICCRGRDSCLFVNTISVYAENTSIVCEGVYSCQGGIITTASEKYSDIYCTAGYSCTSSDIFLLHNDNDIYCQGYYSCSWSRIESTGTSGASNSVYCGAASACYTFTTVGVSEIYLLGQSSATDGKIISNGIGNMNVYMLAYQSGYRVNIYCNVSDTCLIQCGVNDACSDSSSSTDVYCMGTCIIICDETNGIDCPNTPVTSGTVITTDTLPPTSEPTLQPSFIPTNTPTDVPSLQPSGAPSFMPSVAPSYSPTISPTQAPSDAPYAQPTGVPSMTPSTSPSSHPTAFPSSVPTDVPTNTPTDLPSATPTGIPTIIPSIVPTIVPSSVPSSEPSSLPSVTPTSQPSVVPTIIPSLVPTGVPSGLPTQIPTTDESGKNKNNGTGGLDNVSVSTQLWIIIGLLALNLVAGLYCCRIKSRVETQRVLNDDTRFAAALEMQISRLRSVSEN